MSSASNHQKDLFIFGPFGKKTTEGAGHTSQDFINGTDIWVHRNEKTSEASCFVGFGAQDTTNEEKFKEREKRDFMTSILKLIQVRNYLLFYPMELNLST